MSLLPGTRLGAYEVVSLLGAGGMGEVYRARDTRLDRHVAIKLILETVAPDPERLERFTREAKLLASLNHPHIAQIYGLEESGPTRALVMELVDGPTLADRVAQGALQPDEAVRIARQIAEALEAAHEQGIIHRDLKPANIKLRGDGAVKVLDFGLAKLADTGSGPYETSALTSPVMTRAGVVLGTPAYMSPEQARGQAVDARTDLWAFGCVCYEMLVGRRAFDGETASDAIASVLAREPAWDALPAGTPAGVRRLLRRCLARDLTRRLRHAGDARLELEEIGSGHAADAASPLPDRQAAYWSYLPWGVAAAASIAALWLGWRAWGTGIATTSDGAPTTRLELSLPPGLELFPSTSSTVIASPDGQSIAFVGTSGGSRQLFLRRLDGFDAMPVRGTSGATTCAFSPDGASLAFVTAGGELKTVSLSDGLVTAVTRDASVLQGIAWAAADEIVFNRAGTLWATAPTGGSPRPLTTLGPNEQAHTSPSPLPGGGTVLFTARTAKTAVLEAITLATGERRVILNDAMMGKAGPEGRLFFYRDGRMLSTAFDAAALRAIGAPTPLLDRVPDLGGGTPVGDVSPAGLIVFLVGAPQRRLVWVTREGIEHPMSDAPGTYMNPRLSPDGTRLLVQAGGIWVHDLRRDALQRLPTPGTPANAFPMWLPDGTTVLYRSAGGLRLQSTESDAQGRVLPGTTEFDYPGAMTPDGQTLVLQRSTPETSFDVLVAPLSDSAKAKAIVQTPAYEAGARLSPDGRWLVYVSNESGANEVYVRPFQEAARRRQVSKEGGSQPVWSPAGGEIFYRTGDRMMVVRVNEVGNDLQLSAARQLFSRVYAYGAGITIANYDVTKDGQRFVMVRDDATVGRLAVVLNWRASSGPAAPGR